MHRNFAQKRKDHRGRLLQVSNLNTTEWIINVLDTVWHILILNPNLIVNFQIKLDYRLAFSSLITVSMK